jgi:hypothetical protein
MAYNTYAYDKIRAEDQPRNQKYFESKFEARIEDSKEYRHYMRQVPHYRDFHDLTSYKLETEIVPMKAIHLSSNNLERLIAEQRHLDSLQNDAEEGKRLWAEARRDRMIRDENPAVEKAYQKYTMLLELARR